MLNLDPWTVLWTGINLVVLYLLMRHFLFKPVTAMMEQRTKAIEDGLSQAEAAKQAAQALDQENEARLAQVRGQADQIVAQAKLQGQREYDQIISSAQADAQAIRADAQAQMEAERRQMLQDAQQQWPLWPCWRRPRCPAAPWTRRATGTWWRIFCGRRVISDGRAGGPLCPGLPGGRGRRS